MVCVDTETIVSTLGMACHSQKELMEDFASLRVFHLREIGVLDVENVVEHVLCHPHGALGLVLDEQLMERVGIQISSCEQAERQPA